MLICFFDQKGFVHKKFVPPGPTVNAAFYVKVLRRLRENVQRKRPDPWQNNTWLLHHDNVPAHAALPTRRFLTDNNMTGATSSLLTQPCTQQLFLISKTENEA
jgi:hypothetical protein